MTSLARRKQHLRRIAIGTALLVVTACAAGLWQARSRWRFDPLSRAAHAYDEGRFSTAAEFSRQALKSKRDDPRALRLLARSSARLGHDDTALSIYSRRLGDQVMEAEDYLLLGLAHQRRGRSEVAARTWGKLLDAPQLTPRLVEELARLHIEGHRPAEAIQLAEHLSRQPGWEARGSMMLGIIRAALKDARGAADLFHRAMKADPEEVDKSGDPTHLRKLIARTFLQCGQASPARVLLKSILARGPDREAAWLLSRAFLQEGDKTKASAALAEASSYRAENPLEAEPSPYLGEASCEECHAAIFRDSLLSRHTQSYYRGAQLDRLPLPDRPLPDPDDAQVSHAFKKQNGAIWEETTVGRDVNRAIVEYAFGTSDRYLTMVSRDARGAYHIARLSYYDTLEGRGWDRTILDITEPSRGRAQEFQGQSIGVRDGVARCLYCHATNPRAALEPIGPKTGDRAIGCERCHGPGGNHVAAVQAHFPELAIVNPTAVSPAAVTTRQCNDCHILDNEFRNGDHDNPGWVRSQGVGWTWSRCNTESGGAFGCVTCHDPHKSARATTIAEYESKCRTCHGRAVEREPNGKSGSTPVTSGLPITRICPVDPSSGCVRCHMPRVRIDPLHTDLTDHFIRVDQKKRSLPPTQR